jgi:hypothetical protein
MQLLGLPPSRPRRTLCLSGGLPLFAALFGGCASPGPPLPPSLHLPEPVKALRAERVGGQVVLSFTVSDNTTDGDALRGPIVAVLCRETPNAAQAEAMASEPAEKKPKSQAAKPVVTKGRKNAQPTPNVPVAVEPAKGPPCLPVQRVEVPRGANRLVESLPRELTAGAPALIAYRVELLNDHGRGDGPSPAVFASAGAAPPPVGVIALSPGRAGIAVRWQPRSGNGTMELTRTLVASEAGSAADPATGGHRTSKTSQPLAIPSRRQTAGATHREEPVRLAAGPAGATQTNDPGGLVDATARNGGTYQYVAQRVEQVQVAGRTLELRGEPSPPATIVFHDVFPPLAVTGLVALPSFGGTPSIDLSWEPGSDPDVAGYNVYRAVTKASGPPVKLNAQPIPGPAYRDLKAVVGTEYTYTVTAVDTLGNESQPSAAVRESLDKP